MPKNQDRSGDDMSREELFSHLDRIADEVRTWPDWKARILGPCLPEHFKPKKQPQVSKA